MKASGSKIFAPIIILFIFIACSKKQEISGNEAENSVLPDTVASGKYHSSPSGMNKDSARKFIRTAELTFKVKKINEATYSIEKIVNKMGGFVTYTSLQSPIERKTNVTISVDSSIETSYYTATNTMTIRIPNTKLDTTLSAITQLVDFLDSRTIKAEDVSLQLYANTLTQYRVRGYEKSWLKTLQKQKRKEDGNGLGENLMYHWEKADEAIVDNLSLKDKVDFSTIQLYIYQSPSVKQELIAHEKETKPYEPGFGAQLLTSLEYGWDILESIVLLLARLWPLILLGIAIFIGYKQLIKQ